MRFKSYYVITTTGYVIYDSYVSKYVKAIDGHEIIYTKDMASAKRWRSLPKAYKCILDMDQRSLNMSIKPIKITMEEL